MDSPNRAYLPAVDHLRAFAALLILLYHSIHLLYPRLEFHRAWQPSDWPHTGNPLLATLLEGHSAVALFLVISGFILTYGSLGRHIHWPDFYRNRLLRIFPLYLFVLLTGANAFPQKFKFPEFLSSLFQFGYLAGGLSFGEWTGVAWSISVEAHLYLLFPAVLHYLNAGKLGALLRLAVLVWLVRFAAVSMSAGILDVTYWTVLGRTDQFFAGAILAWAVHRYGMPGRLRWLFPVAAAGVVFALWGFHASGGWPVSQEWRILWPIAEALIWTAFVACYLATAPLLPKFADSALRYLGKVSYSVYLVHVPVITILAARNWFVNISGAGAFGNTLLTAICVVLPVSVGFGSLTWTAIEEPFLAMRRRYRESQPIPIDQ